ncbi:MAG: hypothetical protein WCY16_10125 [Weeksellaceae bacterium]
MEKEIKIAIIKLLPSHELAVNACLSYFDLTRDELVGKTYIRSHSEKRALLFTLLKSEGKFTPSDIANLFGTTRQNVAYSIESFEIKKNIYLRNTCDYRNVKSIFLHLLKQQEECLQNLSQ